MKDHLFNYNDAHFKDVGDVAIDDDDDVKVNDEDAKRNDDDVKRNDVGDDVGENEAVMMLVMMM